MLAYKYRGLSNDGIERAIDILERKRLYCAPRSTLNDPMEGYFKAFDSDFQRLENIRIMAKQVVNAMSGYRICSLSSVKDSPLMWAYYADDFAGLAIEVDIMKVVSRIEDVAYNDGHNLAEYDPDGDVDMLARRFLLTKNKAWRHEKEIRVLENANDDNSKEPVFHNLVQRPPAIYLGVNVSRTHKERLLDVCDKLHIDVHEMTLRGYKIAFRKLLISDQTSMFSS